MSFSFPPNSTSQDPFTGNEPLLTVDQMKQRYLFGLDLTDKHGNPIPDEVFQHQLNSSLSFLEHKLDIIILAREFTEEYDYRAQDYIDFNFIQLKKRPVSEVIKMKARFPNNRDLVEYPTSWYVVEKESAQVQLSPIEGSFSGLIVTQGGSYMPLIFGTRDYWPHLFQIQYKAGFCADQIPVIINEMIGMQAAIRAFEVLGDILFGPGILSESVSMDAASVSKGLANSQKYALFSGRITSYKEQMKEYIETVKKHYNGSGSAVV